MIHQCSDLSSANDALYAPPIGFIYIQFSGSPAPSDIWKGTTWTNTITSPSRSFGGLCPVTTSTAGVCLGSSSGCNNKLSSTAGGHCHCSGWSTSGAHCHTLSLTGCSYTAPLSVVVRVWRRTA